MIARDQMLPQSKPLFTGVQLSPLSVDRKTTPPKICPCKNVATRIGYQRANIGLDHVVINFYPTVSRITRAVNAASSTDKVSSYENVPVRVDCQGAFIERKQPIVNLLPILPVVARVRAGPARSNCHATCRVSWS